MIKATCYKKKYYMNDRNRNAEECGIVVFFTQKLKWDNKGHTLGINCVTTKPFNTKTLLHLSIFGSKIPSSNI